MQIYIHRNQEQLGPFSEAEIKTQLAAGTLSREDLIWWEGQAGWVALGQSALAASLGATAPPPPAPVQVSPIRPAPMAPVASGDRTSGLAIGALVSGLATFFVGITFIVAIILGHLGLSEIRRNPGMKGRGMALTGLIIGYAYPVLVILAISVLLALGQQVRSTFQTINAQLAQAQAQTNSDQTSGTAGGTNGADTASPNSTTNAPDSTTNAAPQTNSP